MTNLTPPGISPDVLQEKITQMLEQNGTLSLDERNKLQLYMWMDIRADVKSLLALSPRVKKLEEANIIMQIQKHPKIAGSVMGALLLFVMFLQEIGNWIASHVVAISNLKIP